MWIRLNNYNSLVLRVVGEYTNESKLCKTRYTPMERVTTEGGVGRR